LRRKALAREKIRYNSPKGRHIGWKSVWSEKRLRWSKTWDSRYTIVLKLEIPASADVICANGLNSKYEFDEFAKRRTSKAKVLKLFKAEYKIDKTSGKEKIIYTELPDGIGYSDHDPMFSYRVGQTVEPALGFNTNFAIECGSGIHYFRTRNAATGYLGVRTYHDERVNTI
jgi:hypothetical protein